MLTSLKITASFSGGDEKAPREVVVTLGPLEILALLQQALPSVKAPAGSGMKRTPFTPTTPAEWFYCAKLKPTDIKVVRLKEALYVEFEQGNGKGGKETVRRPYTVKKTVSTTTTYYDGDAPVVDRARQPITNKTPKVREIKLSPEALNTRTLETLSHLGATVYRDEDGEQPVLKQSSTYLPTALRFSALEEGKAWFQVNGHFLTVNPTNLYASDYGTAIGPRPAREETTYRNMWGELSSGRGTLTDQQVAALMRKLLQGTPCQLPGGAAVLPLLTTTLFVSEVARNHTAFHSNLMLLDLIEHAKFMDTSLGEDTKPITWARAIWGLESEGCGACSATGERPCNVCDGHGVFKAAQFCHSCTKGQCNTCKGTGLFRVGVSCRACNKGKCIKCKGDGIHRPAVMCQFCDARGTPGFRSCTTCRGTGEGGTHYDERQPKGFNSGSSKLAGGGETSLQAGLLAMSHSGSARGSAYDLTGQGSYFGVWNPGDKNVGMRAHDAPVATLSIVRRKEATIAIRWLSHALKKVDETTLGLASGRKVSFRTEVGRAALTLTEATRKKAYDIVDAQYLAALYELAMIESELDEIKQHAQAPRETDAEQGTKLRARRVKLEDETAGARAILTLFQQRVGTFDDLLA